MPGDIARDVSPRMDDDATGDAVPMRTGVETGDTHSVAVLAPAGQVMVPRATSHRVWNDVRAVMARTVSAQSEAQDAAAL
jgi:hypothetical protein